MARISRKKKIYDKENTVKEKIFKCVIYARLSIENSGKDDEGDSIENQIRFCKSYGIEHPYLNLVVVGSGKQSCFAP